MKPTYKELLEMSVEDLANLVVAQGAKIDSINEIKAKTIEDARDHVRATVGMNGGTYSALSKYANKLREVKQ